MTSPVRSELPSPLEAALADVYATLQDLLVAAEDQHAAAVARDCPRLESVTLQQEHLSTRLARAERRRLDLLAGRSLDEATAELPANQARRVADLASAIASAVRELQQRHARTASLLQRSAEMASQAIQFLQRLVAPESPAYGPRGQAAARPSLLVDTAV